ncbi:MAG: RedB protein [Candidatus Obscuribacterales bacterium]
MADRDFKKHSKLSAVLLAVSVVVYVLALITCQAISIAYETAPGGIGANPGTIPPEYGELSTPGKMTLLVFIHPMCPCSRASLGELEKIMAKCGDKLSTTVIFLRPDREGGNWQKSDLLGTATRIPGVGILMDRNGRASHRFGALTSGFAVLYDCQGRLRFCGGITGSRGHMGDNLGSRTIQDIATGRENATKASNPVFGCPLFEEQP